MSYFMQNGDLFSPTPGKEALLDELPAGNYIVVETMSGLMFKKVDDFEAPGRMYGRITERADRILSTFQDRPRTTGVLLSGEKGSGKSQLARNISYMAKEKGIPTIIVNAPFCGDAFNALLATVEQPAIVQMDEFEKVYSHNEQQEAVLTLLDGMMTTKKLFVLTVNDKFRVNEHMKNRPGRIFYAIEFAGLEPEFVREYCEDNLVDQNQIDGVLKASALFKAFNFDMLKAMVEEMNRYNESAFEAMLLLNARPNSRDQDDSYEVFAVSPNGYRSTDNTLNDLPMNNQHGRMGCYLGWENPSPGATPAKLGSQLNALFKELDIDIDDFDEDDDLPEQFHRNFVLETSNLKKVEPEEGKYEFEVDGFKIFIKRKKAKQVDYLGLY